MWFVDGVVVVVFNGKFGGEEKVWCCFLVLVDGVFMIIVYYVWIGLWIVVVIWMLFGFDGKV